MVNARSRRLEFVGTSLLFNLCLLTDVFAGVIRFYSSKLGVLPLVYLPKLLFMMFPFFIIFIKRKISFRFSVLFIILVVSAAYGTENFPSIYQSVFGIWVLAPFLFGFWGSSTILQSASGKQKFLLMLFFVSSVGVVMNTQMAYPWVGGFVNVGGANVLVSKDLTDYGYQRYGGFALASFDAGAQILCLATWTIAYSRNAMLSSLIWILCGVSITITTTKGILASYFLLTFYFLIKWIIGLSKPVRYFWCFILYIFFCIDIYFPLYSLGNATFLRFHSFLELFVLESFGDRLSYMWPGSFSLLSGTTQWLFGRGVGGIGDAQVFFEPNKLFAGDNIFVYLTVEFGLVATVLLLGIFVVRSATRFIEKDEHPLIFPFVLLIISYGLVVPIVDWQTLSVIFGMVAGNVFRIKNDSDILVLYNKGFGQTLNKSSSFGY